MKDSKRFFSNSQKNELYILYDGKCALCNSFLSDDWEADHIIPWSSGGKTIIENGQPVCQLCNRKKGNKKMISLRVWQNEFMDHYFSEVKTNYLMVACPAAGKTTASLVITKRLLDERVIRKIIIVCPTSSLLKQWATEATKHNINIDPFWSSKGIKSDYHGISLTYAKVSTSSEILRYICRQGPTLVILDEVHHAGEDLSWGKSVKHAFSAADLVLSLSGTPFRSDNNPIPFVSYDVEGKAVADYYYSYGDAIKDDICRKTMFPALDGGAEFYFRGEITSWDSFDDTKNDNEASLLLRALLTDSEGDYLKEIMRQAHKRLEEFRKEEKNNPGGLIVAIDISHARMIARMLKAITGIKPVVITSDDADSDKKIAKFRESRDPWAIAVRKISEGVDIPRLKVGIYATNVLTEVYFRQFCGRFWRKKGEKFTDDWCVIYAPRVPKLVEYMERIRKEVMHVIEQKEAITKKKVQRGEHDTTFIALSSEPNPNGDMIISHEYNYNYEHAKEMKEKLEKIGIDVNEWVAANLIDIAQSLLVNPGSKELPIKEEFPKSVYETEKEMRKICNKLVRSLTYEIQSLGFSFFEYKDIVTVIHGMWKNKPGNHSQNEASVKELKEKQSWIETGVAKVEVTSVLRRKQYQ